MHRHFILIKEFKVFISKNEKNIKTISNILIYYRFFIYTEDLKGFFLKNKIEQLF